MGSACLFFELEPAVAVLSDINNDLIRTFLAVRDHPIAVSNRLSKIPKGKSSYYRVRKQRMSELDALDAAANFIFLNRYCFNGLYRTNLDGHFNVPFGASKTGKLPSRNALRFVSAQLKKCKISCGDFLKTLKATRLGDFVYLDPPFAVSNQRVFTQYDPSSFGLDDLERLANELEKMGNRGVKFVLSYADCPEAKRHFGDWRFRRVLTQRNIAGFSAARRRSPELIFTNIDVEAA
jgi:DNA adenine methylase